MTVTPKRMCRREPLEKEHMSKNGVIKVNDQAKISGLSPVWMHDQSAHGAGKPKPMGEKLKLKGGPGSFIFRNENSRLHLLEVDQPPKSIFNIGTTRHNKFMPDGVQFLPVCSGMTLTEKPTRILDWIEKQGGRTSKREITGKIGQ